MDLKEFVAESLKQIIEGVKEAQDHAEAVGAEVGKSVKGGSNAAGFKHVKPGDRQEVEFDVAVSTQERSEISGKGGVTVLSWFKAEGGGSSGEQSATASRVKFNVPVRFPGAK